MNNQVFWLGIIEKLKSVELLGLNRNTAKLHFRQLVQEGHLLQHGSGRGTWYSAGR